jgi:hypothetical protein
MYSKLFEKIYYECRLEPLVEQVLREANQTEAFDDVLSNEEKQETKDLIFLEDLTKMTNVLSTQKPEIISHSSLGNIVLYAGEAKKKSFGLKHIIFSRMTDNNYNKTDDQITAILALICSALHNGKVVSNNSGRFEISKNGILAIVDTMKTRKGKQIFLLTGFDIQKNTKEVTDAIQTVNAQYSSTPEYSGFRKQVVAVTSNII